ncbi:MAG: 7-cyano-7-deazaguanine synthase QueC [Chthoniobacterales bacterium]|nr:7-cyano-7-deazaguanine synthase QueC [Chthoniobacterales bacterium]
MKAAVLVSGGMDSVTALYDTASRQEATLVISFNYGSKHNAREIPFARWHAQNLNLPFLLLDLPFIGQFFSSHLLLGGGEIPKGHYEEQTMRQTVVPFRNGIFLSIAAGLAESHGCDTLVIAAHSGDHAIYPDCRETFLQAMQEAIRLGTYANIRLLRPFVGMDKTAIAKRGAQLGVDFSKTWSCYVGGEIHCGECGTCIERREAFLKANLPDPTHYLKTPPIPPKPTPCT